MTTVLIRAGEVFRAGEWCGPEDIVIRDGLVVRAHDAGSTPSDHVLDAADCWVVPALTDAHCHLLPSHLLRLPLYGVGFAVDMFATPDMRQHMDEEAEAGGARYATSGVGATVRGGHPYQLVRSGVFRDFPSVDEAGGPAAFVDQQIAGGASMLKVFLDDGRLALQSLPTLAPSTVAAVVEHAHAHGLPVVAHAPTCAMAIGAVEAGVDGLAHMPVPEGRTDADEFVATTAEHGTFVVSTVLASGAALGVRLIDTLPRSPIWSRVPPAWQVHLERLGRDEPDYSAVNRLLELVAAVHRAGVAIFPGTDAAFPGVMPGASLHAELEILSECGVGASELLHAASSGARRRLGLGPMGTGLSDRAEFLVLEEDPRQSITASRSMRAVVLGHHVYRFTGRDVAPPSTAS